ncbi:MAG TPA: glycosyltransferase [Aliiroseovarius sp.]|nr:glycosyltransferase [Aliiroseovarius sp.]
MRAPISVVIPTLNAEEALPYALSTLGEGLEAGLIRELLIADGGSCDATLKLAGAAGAEVVNGAQGRGAQIAAGCAAAQGDWLLILHADSALQPGWAGAVLAALSTPEMAGYFRLSFRARGPGARLVAGWANFRARRLGLPFGDQGLLISRALLERVGGYPSLELMEDVAIARALSGRLVALDAALCTGAERYTAEGWLRRGARNITLQIRFLLGADPAALARSYRARR